MDTSENISLHRVGNIYNGIKSNELRDIAKISEHDLLIYCFSDQN